MPDPRVELRITARDQTQAAIQSVKQGLGSLNTQIGSLRAAVQRLGPAFAAIGAGLSVAVFGRLVKSGIDAADQLGVVSKRTGVAVEDLSALKFVAEQSETNFETLTAGLQRFELNLAKAGISGQNTIGVLTALADRVKQTEDPAKRLEIAFKTFGRSAGPELVPFLAQGGEGINALIQKIRDLGGIITGDMARASDDFNDQLGAIQTQLTAAATILGGGFLKGLGDLSAFRLDDQLRQDIEALGRALGAAARFAVEFADKIAIAVATVAGFAAGGPIGGVLAGLGTAAVVGSEGVERLGISAKGFANDAAQLKDRIGELQAKVKDYRGELEKLGAGDPAGQRLGIEKGIANAEIAIGRLQTRLGELGKTETKPGSSLQGEVDRLLAGGDEKVKKARRGGGGAGTALNDAKQLIEASLTATQEALDREQRNLEQALDEELVSFRDFYARRTAIAVAGIDAEIAAKREALAVSKDQGDVGRLTQEITVLERKRGDVAVQARRDQITAERELGDQLAEVRARVLEAEGRTAEATRIRLEAEFRELTARLQIEGDTAGVELVKRLFNIEAARGQLQQMEEEVRRFREQLARDETRIQVEVDTGLKSEIDGRRELVALHQRTSDALDPIIDKMRIIAQTIGPEEVARVEALAGELENLDAVSGEIANSLNNDFKQAAASAFSEFIRGTKTAQQAFADFGSAILDSLANIAAEAIVQDIFGSLFKGGSASRGPEAGGVKDLLRTLGSLFSFGGLFHQGGIVGAPGPFKRVPALAFAGAPRLHEGGMLGLRRDEVPAILQRGEEVLTRGDPRHRANRGAGDVTVVMNITTPDVQGFRRSSGQIAVEASTAIGRAARNRP